MRRVVIVGSTGSVGTQALDVIRRNPERFTVVGLAAGGANVELLAAQALEFGVEVVGVARATAAQDLQLALYTSANDGDRSRSGYDLPKVVAGPDASAEVAAWPCDVVLNAVTGSIGLAPTLAAIAAGHVLALANKESLIVGGPLVKKAAAAGQIVPVDSEHSALAQCLTSGRPHEVARLILTASGGPFRGRSRESLSAVTPADALAHPTWDMGPVVTVNSATLVNKGLELIEAHLLFDVPIDQVDVVVHPQSVVHSMVEFIDGSTLAQVSPPDMRLPIAWGLAWPERVANAASACDWSVASRWEFEPLDVSAFPAVDLARTAAAVGRSAPAVFNAANEECVELFLAEKLPFLAIVDTVKVVLAEHLASLKVGAVLEDELTLDDVLGAEAWARSRTHEILEVAR
ncbi:MAG: 1-deoxy-D-xylulose-5-phosphate reductoisomerase [Candidatus Nanopelagicales bacterium]